MLKRAAILFFLSFTILTGAKAQTDEVYKYEAGLKLFSFSEIVPVENSNYNNSTYYFNFLTGVIFKMYENQFAYRLSINYKDYSNAEQVNFEGRYKEASFRIGFDKDFLYSKLRPYIGFEIFYYRSDFKGPYLDNIIQNATLVNIRNGVGFSPLLGIKYTPISQLTISAESNIEGIFLFDQRKYYTDNSSITTSLPGNDHFEMFFNPLAMFSVSYNFGSND